MNIITRRSFMKRSLWAAAGMALGSMLNVPGFLRRALADETLLPANGNKLLFIFLNGGNDSLNTLIPTGDDAYSLSLRPNLYVPGPSSLAVDGQCVVGPPGQAIDLGNEFATLHPSMTDVCPVYDDGDIAFCHRVGYPDQSRSHFDSQRYWEIGIPRDDNDRDGVFYRALTETGLEDESLLPAVTFGRNMPLLIRGDVPFTNINDPARFDLLGVYAEARLKHIQAIERIHGQPYAAKANRDLVFPTGERFVSSIEAIRAVQFQDNDSERFLDDNGQTHLFPLDQGSDEGQFDKQFGSRARSFFRSLKYSAQVLAETDAIISGTELGGFDTHSNQLAGGNILAGTHADRMAWLAWAMYALKKYLSHPSVDKWDKTVVVTMSEFGRTSAENGSKGTDHAEAGVMFVAGGPVHGGVYQCNGSSPLPVPLPGHDLANPWDVGGNTSMLKVNGRYLQRSTDYRSVLGEIIREHLGASQAQLDTIIPGYANPAENLLTGGTSVDGTAIVGELGLLG